ncbi:hypothetical protein RND81_03G128200 [Saponaria officinalis]|uniref:Uncharacterized protein n=1 Tax=Saponaria officinalis TaxID=3572 RepID=A0AAW1M8B4_SAPOF
MPQPPCRHLSYSLTRHPPFLVDSKFVVFHHSCPQHHLRHPHTLDITQNVDFFPTIRLYLYSCLPPNTSPRVQNLSPILRNFTLKIPEKLYFNYFLNMSFYNKGQNKTNI